jgi:mRNA-degrading endonuclease RelE of RelBE toxin-antitoxin system
VPYAVIVTSHVIYRVSELSDLHQQQIERRLARLADELLPAEARVSPGLQRGYRIRVLGATIYYHVFERSQIILVNRLSYREP